MQTRPRRNADLVALLAIVLTAAAALVAGCSADKADRPLPDAATLVKESSQTTRDQHSAHLQLTVKGEIKDLPLESLNGDLTNTPQVAAQGSANLLFLGERVDDVDFVVYDGILYAAITKGSFQDFGPAADIYDVSAILNPDVGLANVLANFSDPKAEGRETINGVEAVRITGNVSADAVNKIAPQIGATGPLPGTAWISEDGDHQLVQARLDPSPDDSITMAMTEWGKPVTVTKPAV